MDAVPPSVTNCNSTCYYGDGHTKNIRYWYYNSTQLTQQVTKSFWERFNFSRQPSFNDILNFITILGALIFSNPRFFQPSKCHLYRAIFVLQNFPDYLQKLLVSCFCYLSNSVYPEVLPVQCIFSARIYRLRLLKTPIS